MEYLYVKNLLIKRLLNSLIALIAIVFLQSSFLAAAYAGNASTSSIRDLLVDDNESEAVLPPEVAFKLSLIAIDTQNIQSNFTIVSALPV